MIRRIRIGFLVLALVLLAPLWLLLSRTLDGLERERELRHTAVASRVFDEAERQLSAFLAEEEARPADRYRAVLPSGAASPLAGPPSREFVMGYFQFDARGQIASPRADASAGFLAELRSILPAPGAVADRDLAASDFFAQKKGKLEAAKKAQLPGTTRVVQKVGVTGRAAVEEERAPELAAAEEQKESLSSYSVLERLNRATQSRRDTRKEVAGGDYPVPAASLPAQPEKVAQLEAAAEFDDMASADAKVAPARKLDRMVGGIVRSTEPVFRPSEGRVASEANVADEVRPASRPVPASPPLRARLRTLSLGPSPLTGARVGPDRLVLYRTTVLPGEDGPVHQGLLVDMPRMTAWLRAEVLGKSGLLDSLALEFGGADGSGEPAAWPAATNPEDRFVYEHRFGEPFETVSARLSLAPLPDEGGTRYVYWMGLLLVVASTAGLYAVYRRVATAVHFAERRSNFAAAVSHELKTPLTAIRMYAEMLRDGMVSEDAKRQEYYATITSESERLTRLIDNVLEFSKLENDRRELSMTTASIEQPLRDVVRVVEPHAVALGFTLKLEIEPGLPAVPHDPDALQQILFNLIDNALKYARDAEPAEVSISARERGDGAQIRVRDHGPGVDAAHLPHVFDAFYRGENELTRRTKGTGIGLALVRGLVEQMHGTVSARNHPDGGLELELQLPG